ncbi:AtaL-like protein [Geomesophilobacter sediminis]|uniref:DUF1857 family protein n=1 Tax=Geomesophilobacter sediminis TaxID=2798584 RepID=A0A8J7M0F9_9BACT|nr:AtaL-like protein [Geomesophilobacter sediminis]MBJ6724977.1 DUF1857 family protein [Geomesophilobacter sediminis]
MRKLSFTTEVYASFETMWDLLLRKVEEPQAFLPDVIRARVLQQYPDGVLREVRTDGMLVKEKVVLDRAHGEVHFFMVEHPLFSGRVVHRISATSTHNPAAPLLLTIEMHWNPKDYHGEQVIEAEYPAQIERDVLLLKKEAEVIDGDVRQRFSRYSFGKTLAVPYHQAVRRVRDELQKEGFGVITEIDVRQKFRVKLEKDFRNYLIIGACSPALAYQALGVELDVGTLLPCNVVIYEVEEGKSEVVAMDPVAALAVVGNPRLGDIAANVKGKLERVLAAL